MEYGIFEIIRFLLGVFFSIVALGQIFFPKWMWEKFESWRGVEEPSEVYFTFGRIIGIIALVIIFYIFFVPIGPLIGMRIYK